MASSPYTLEEIDLTLTALIAFSGNIAATRRELERRELRVPTADTIKQWVTTEHWERYEEIRDRYEAKIEAKQANDLLDLQRAATEGAMCAVQKAVSKLDSDPDPGRTAANLARVAQSATDKRLSLQGRPSRIVETRGAEEYVRSLVQKGVLVIADNGEAQDDRRELQESNPEP